MTPFARACIEQLNSRPCVCRALALHSFAVLRFDFTGLGGGEGEFSNTDFSSNVDDLVRATDHLREQYQAPSLLVGHMLKAITRKVGFYRNLTGEQFNFVEIAARCPVHRTLAGQVTIRTLVESL